MLVVQRFELCRLPRPVLVVLMQRVNRRLPIEDVEADVGDFEHAENEVRVEVLAAHETTLFVAFPNIDVVAFVENDHEQRVQGQREQNEQLNGAVPGDAEVMANFPVLPLAQDDEKESEVADDDDQNEDQVDDLEKAQLHVLVDAVVDLREARVVLRRGVVEHRAFVVRIVDVHFRCFDVNAIEHECTGFDAEEHDDELRVHGLLRDGRVGHRFGKKGGRPMGRHRV